MFRAALVNPCTRDIEAALHFYCDLLTFGETFRTPTEGVPEHVALRLDPDGNLVEIVSKRLLSTPAEPASATAAR